MGLLYLVNAHLDIVELPLKLLPLAFLAHLDFLELRMPDNHGIIIPRGNPAAELLAVGGLKILLGGDEDVGTGIEPQVLGSPLPDKVVGDDKHGFLAQA